MRVARFPSAVRRRPSLPVKACFVGHDTSALGNVTLRRPDCSRCSPAGHLLVDPRGGSVSISGRLTQTLTAGLDIKLLGGTRWLTNRLRQTDRHRSLSHRQDIVFPAGQAQRRFRFGEQTAAAAGRISPRRETSSYRRRRNRVYRLARAEQQQHPVCARRRRDFNGGLGDGSPCGREQRPRPAGRSADPFCCSSYRTQSVTFQGGNGTGSYASAVQSSG